MVLFRCLELSITYAYGHELIIIAIVKAARLVSRLSTLSGYQSQGPDRLMTCRGEYYCKKHFAHTELRERREDL